MTYGKRILGIALLAVTLITGSGFTAMAEQTVEDATYMGQMLALNSIISETMAYGGEHASEAVYDPEVQAKMIAGYYTWQYVDTVFDTLEPTDPFVDSHEAYGVALDVLVAISPTCIYGLANFHVPSVESCTEGVLEATNYIALSRDLLPESL